MFNGMLPRNAALDKPIDTFIRYTTTRLALKRVFGNVKYNI